MIEQINIEKKLLKRLLTIKIFIKFLKIKNLKTAIQVLFKI